MAMILQTSRLRLTQAIYFGEPPGTGGVTQLTPAGDITMVPNPIIGVGTIGVTPGTFVRADGTVPLTANWNAGNFRIDSQNSTRWFNVVAYGADPTGVALSTVAISTAIAAATSGGVIYFPHGTYKIDQQITIATGGITLQGDGKGTTFIDFEPAPPPGPFICFLFSAGAGTINNCGIRDLTFISSDVALTKTAVSVLDAVNFNVDQVNITNGWTGANSVGFRLAGRQELRLRNMAINAADLPIVIDSNPNTAGVGEISFDHSSIESSELVVSGFSGTGTFTAGNAVIVAVAPNMTVNALTGYTLTAGAVTAIVASNTINTITLTAPWAGGNGALAFTAAPFNPVITILDNTVLTNSSFRHLALVRGGAGISANSTAPATAWQSIDICDIRSEQAVDPAAYSIDLRHSGAQIQDLTIHNVTLDPYRNGIRLTGCHWPVLDSVSYGGTGVFGNFSATVEALTIRNSFRNNPATVVDASTRPVCIQFLDGGNVRNGFGTLSPSANPLSVTGILDATQVAVNTTTPTRQIDLNGTQRWRGIAAPAVSEANSATVYFDSASNKLKASLNGGGYVDVIGSGGVTGSGAANQIAYWDGATSLAGTANLVIDPTTGYIGIGTPAIFGVDTIADMDVGMDRFYRSGGVEILHAGVTTGNTFVGLGTVPLVLSSDVTAVGRDALTISTGMQNTAVGSHALTGNGAGTDNVAVGFNAGATNTTGTNNILIGSGADVVVGNLTNAIAIGYQATVAANDSMSLGDSSMKVGIHTTTPKTGLDVDAAVSTRHKNLSLAGGLNSDCPLPDSSWVRIIDPAAPFSVGGFTNGVDGRMLTIYNTTASQMSIDNEDMASTDVNRILTHTGLSINCVVASFIYEDVADRWILVNYV